MLDTTYPLSDDAMVYDYTKHRYILTPQYVLNNLGIDLYEKMGGKRTVNTTTAINVLLDNRISFKIYSAIYAHQDKQLMEYILAKSPSARKVLLEAMSNQLLDLVTYGEKEKEQVSQTTYNALLQPIDETGKSVLYRIYRGFLTYIPTYEEGHY